jgi:hypothetical protein
MTVTHRFGLMSYLFIALGAWGQQFPAAEVEAGYSYARYAFGPYSNVGNLNGGGGSVAFNVNQYVGITVDLRGFGATTAATATFNIPANASFPKGTKGSVDGGIFTYMIGPQVKLRTHGVQPFGRLLFGGAYSRIYRDAFTAFCQQSCSFSTPPGSNAFAVDVGGGLDVPVNKFVAVRPIDISYLITGFSNPFTNNSLQHNVRYAAGIVFTLDRTLY